MDTEATYISPPEDHDELGKLFIYGKMFENVGYSSKSERFSMPI